MEIDCGAPFNLFHGLCALKCYLFDCFFQTLMSKQRYCLLFAFFVSLKVHLCSAANSEIVHIFRCNIIFNVILCRIVKLISPRCLRGINITVVLDELKLKAVIFLSSCHLSAM